MVFEFVEHFIYLAAAMNKSGDDGMWDEEDGFLLRPLAAARRQATRLKVRSIVGLLPLCATTVIEKRQREGVPQVIGASYSVTRLLLESATKRLCANRIARPRGELSVPVVVPLAPRTKSACPITRSAHVSPADKGTRI